jgi:hypothetical protein
MTNNDDNDNDDVLNIISPYDNVESNCNWWIWMYKGIQKQKQPNFMSLNIQSHL